MNNFNKGIKFSLRLLPVMILAVIFIVSACTSQKSTTRTGNLTAQQQQEAKLLGDWELTIETPMGMQNPVLAINEVDGTTALGDLNGKPLTLTIDGENIGFAVERKTPRGSLRMIYDGVVEGENMKGNFSVDTGNSDSATAKTMTWTGTRTEKGTVSLEGDWTFSLDTPAGFREQFVTLKQEGNQATGILNDTLTVFTISGRKITFDMIRDTPIGRLDMNSEGIVKGNKMEGKYTIITEPYVGSSFDWNAVRKESTEPVKVKPKKKW